MSLLPYHKGNKTKFTNLLFQLIPIYLFINGFQMYVVRNDLSMFATIRSNIGAANEKVRRSDLTQVLIAVSMPPRIARGFSFRASSKANVSICSQPEPNGTITLSILVLSKLDNV